MAAKWPAFASPKGAKLDNDKSHGFTDPNSGGGPAAPVKRNFKPVPPASRGGAYQSGLKQYASTSIRGTRGSAGNPANRGGMPSVGRQSFPSETRVPGHGGSPQVRDNLPTSGGTRAGFGVNAHGRGNFNKIAPGAISQYPQASPRPGAGNVAGRMARRITGRFNNKSKGAKSTGVIGDYGRNAITANT